MGVDVTSDQGGDVGDRWFRMVVVLRGWSVSCLAALPPPYMLWQRGQLLNRGRVTCSLQLVSQQHLKLLLRLLWEILQDGCTWCGT